MGQRCSAVPEGRKDEVEPGGQKGGAKPEGQKAGRMRLAVLSMMMVQKALAPIQLKVVEDYCNRYHLLW